MSTVIVKNVQVGNSGTATNNFTWYQPASPDGTVRLGVGNTGATTADVITATSAGNVGIGTSSPASRIHVQRPDDGTIATFRGTSNAQLLLGISSGNLVYDASNGNAAHVFQTNSNERARIDVNGNFSITQTPGRYTVDVTGGATSIANSGTVDFPNASGMLVVNNSSNGNVTIYLCGGGVTAAIGSVGGQVGTLAYNAGIGG